MAVDAVVLLEEIIIQEILIRLPIKSMVRCRCVCRSWNSQFYNPDFFSLLNHHHRSIISLNPKRDKDDDCLIFLNSYYNREATLSHVISILSLKKLSETRIIDKNYVPYPLSVDSYNIHFVGSINGLVCIAFFDFVNAHQFVLWNPIIRFSKKISLVGMHISCYPLVYGFGWDSVTNDYKLIAIPWDRGLSPVVYSCKTDCWSNINPAVSMDNSSIFIHEWERCPSVIVNGSPYWCRGKDRDVLKFDITCNGFTYLKLPSRDSGVYTNLINLNDCLAFISYNSYRGEAKVYSYDHEQHNVWMHMYTFYKYMSHDDIEIHCFNYGGEIVFHGKKHLYLYDPKSREIKSQRLPYTRCSGNCRRGCSRDCGGRLVNGFSFTPSLVALPGMKALHL